MFQRKRIKELEKEVEELKKEMERSFFYLSAQIQELQKKNKTKYFGE